MSSFFFGLIVFLFCGYGFGLIANPLLLLLLITFFTVAGHILTWLLVRLLTSAALMDQPNARSMHEVPVPRGGGWSYVTLLMLGFGLVLSCTFSRDLLGFDLGAWLGGKATAGTGQCILLERQSLYLFGGFIILALVSWLDDCRGVPARYRLVTQFIAVAMPLTVYPVQLLFPDWLPAPLAYVFAAIGWVWFINLFNFMDGIDGITATETLFISMGVAIAGFKIFTHLIALNDLVQVLILVLFSVSVAFLAYNWHPARIFLGDVGSISIGYILGFCLLHLAALGYWPIALTLPLYYLTDSGLTLVRRALRGDSIWEPHREHLYQIAARIEGRHDTVVVKIALCNLALLLIALASLAFGPWVCLAAPLPVIALYAHFAKQARIAYQSIWPS